MAAITFHGRVFSGLGKGAYYVGHPGFRRRFQALLGYEPFPGTLNLKLSSSEEVRRRTRLRARPGVSIPTFTYKGREFSSVKCFHGRMRAEKVALTIPKITEYDDSVLEIIAPVKLRDALGLLDGQVVTVSLETALLLHEDGD
ncbi:MAG: CTP-dependent riboflavin kinase [Nitrososphaerota archaeon]|nr:CTP-dependent riboflavin kinase [Nitrososphaerota archaeon]